MNYLVIGLLCAFLAPSPDLPVEKAPQKIATNAPPEKKDPLEEEYDKLVAQDEAALKEIEKLNTEFDSFQAKGAPGSKAVLAAKIEQRLEPIKKAYDEFLRKHPDYVDAHLAYGSFLNEIGEEEDAIIQWEKARSLDPKNPSPWNNLANVFAHGGPIKKAFQYYERAIELGPEEPVYLHNLATVTYLFRKDAAETYRIDEEAVFNKSLELYRRAMKLDPTNMLLATDYAQSFYGIRPMRGADAVAAWTSALRLAKSQAEKEGIYLHLARVELASGFFAEAQKHLDLVKDPEMLELKGRLQKNLEKKKAEAVTALKAKEPSVELTTSK